MPQLAAGSDLTAQPVALHFSHPRSILFQTELEEEMHRGVSGLARIIGVQQRSAVRPDELNRPFDLVGSCNHAVAGLGTGDRKSGFRAIALCLDFYSGPEEGRVEDRPVPRSEERRVGKE